MSPPPSLARLAALLALAAALAAPRAAALSWPLCDSGGAVWVTERPRTGPTFPGANLWFFCEQGMNILGNAIDPCVQNGTICSPKVADTICSLLGYERAFADDLKIVPAGRGEPVVALTGEFCLRKGLYSRSLPDPAALAALPGEPCDRIAKLTCIRTLDVITAALNIGIQNATLGALDPAPAAEDLPATARLAEASAKEAGATAPSPVAPPAGGAGAGAGAAAVLAPAAPSGRKLMSGAR